MKHLIFILLLSVATTFANAGVEKIELFPGYKGEGFSSCLVVSSGSYGQFFVLSLSTFRMDGQIECLDQDGKSFTQEIPLSFKGYSSLVLFPIQYCELSVRAYLVQSDLGFSLTPANLRKILFNFHALSSQRTLADSQMYRDPLTIRVRTPRKSPGQERGIEYLPIDGGISWTQGCFPVETEFQVTGIAKPKPQPGRDDW